MSHVLPPRINDARALHKVSCKGKCNQACMCYCPLETKNLKVCFILRMSVLSSPQGLVRNWRTGKMLISQESAIGTIK